MLNEGVVGSEARAQIFTLSTPYIPELTEWYPLGFRCSGCGASGEYRRGVRHAALGGLQVLGLWRIG